MVGHAWDGKSHLSYVKEGYANNMYTPLSDFFEHEAWLRTDDSKPLYYYSLVGAFTTFLINNFGKDKFKEMYENTHRDLSKVENLAIFEKIYGPIQEIEIMFKGAMTR
ncbi:MAG: hypothetical protein WCT77_09065, partial [Bacteroidota bacterium]